MTRNISMCSKVACGAVLHANEDASYPMVRRVPSHKIAEAMLERACQGDVRAAREVADRTEGRAMQGVIVGGECENCRENREQMAQALSGLTDQELETIREILERGARAQAAHEP